MSAAEVQFLDLTGEPIGPGEKPARFTFLCVRRRPGVRATCGKLLLAEGPHTQAHGVKRDGQNRDGGRAQWEWDGNREAPILRPSVNCESACGWHGWITKGRCVSTGGVDEPEPTS